MKFLGYERPDGSVGIRNYVLVIPGGLIGTKICEFVEGTKTLMITNDSYYDHTSRDRGAVGRTLIGLGRNPNVASVIIDSSINAAGYAEYTARHLFEEISKSGKRVELLKLGKEGGTLGAIAKGIQIAREMVYDASKIRRQPFDLSRLVLAVKCGASDTTSGIAGNPVIGNLFDRVVEAGGTAILGENTEIVGAEHILAKRAINNDVADRILKVANDIEEEAKSTGEDIRTMNPVPANIAGGISSLEEKSLGAICKSGSTPIQSVLKYSERPTGKGLHFVDGNPTMGIFLGFAASGNIGDDLAVFEPTHGSAPKYAGQYKVNPMAMLLSVKLMLEWLGETGSAGRLDEAIAGVIGEGKVRTYDMGGTNTTLEVAEAVAAKL